MSDSIKSRNVTVEERSFTHANPPPSSEPPFSALQVPESQQSAQIQANQTSNTDNGGAGIDK